eukprot:UN22128
MICFDAMVFTTFLLFHVTFFISKSENIPVFKMKYEPFSSFKIG